MELASGPLLTMMWPLAEKNTRTVEMWKSKERIPTFPQSLVNNDYEREIDRDQPLHRRR
jgi:hypothetical protein